MNVRAQIASVFHLDKCIGCHTCSIACKNVWTNREGAEYMWWNNVETKPGTGYPTLWEDQEKYRGGWERTPGAEPRLKLSSRPGTLGNIFYNPHLPMIDDYYEPFTYRYEDLFNAPAGDDQPTARPISMISGQPIDIQAGPNWDDDLGGSPVYAANDPNLRALTPEEQQQVFELERLVFFYLPRICNHCANAGCLGACPAGAIYKRGEDGIVLISQEKCRAWRMCVSGCPYKKAYYNWSTAKSEKCILCYPRLETGQANACFHACVGRIRYLSVLLYDADAIAAAANVPDLELVEAQRAMILDPFDPAVIEAGKLNGVPDEMIGAAQRSPVYRFVKEWRLALPLRPDFRTLPMLYYVPPMLPVLGRQANGAYRLADDLFSTLENARLGVRYMASLFAAGNEEVIWEVYKRMIAVRTYMRAEAVGDVSTAEVTEALKVGATTAQQAKDIYTLTALPSFRERFVIPPLAREVAIAADGDPFRHQGQTGVGFRRPAKRG